MTIKIGRKEVCLRNLNGMEICTLFFDYSKTRFTMMLMNMQCYSLYSPCNVYMSG